MTDHSALIERLEGGFLSSNPHHSEVYQTNTLLALAAAALRDQQARLEAANQNVCAFAAPWAVQYASDQGYPPSHIHFAHFDILEAAGARMVSFTRHDPSAPNQAKEAGE